MTLRCGIAGLLLVLAAFPAVAAAAQERDILDVALEQPLDTTINGQPVRFGDPDLDSAEIALRDYLPRPWTTTHIHALFLAARTRLEESWQQGNARVQDGNVDEWPALVEQLGTVLAASRDPRAALTLGQVLENPESYGVTCMLSIGVVNYFGADSSYQRPAFEGPSASTSACGGLYIPFAHEWWLLNQREVERRAAAVTAALPPCPDCEQQALAAIDQLRVRRHDSAPTLHLTIQGEGTPRDVRMELTVTPVSGGRGGSRMLTNHRYTSPDIRIRIPGHLLGRGDMRLSGTVTSAGYRPVRIELDRINDARVVPVTLVPE